jgi:DNA-binding Lrp family transcriptional regulator
MTYKSTMDEIDKKLLDILQNDFPLTGRPYSEIASLLAVSEEDIILRLRALKDARIIRRIGAIFDSKKLGYCSTLCAMKVPDDRIDEVARIVNEYPGVTHNYIRSVQHPVSSTLTQRFLRIYRTAGKPRHYQQAGKSRHYQQAGKPRHYQQAGKPRHYQQAGKSRHYQQAGKPRHYQQAGKSRHYQQHVEARSPRPTYQQHPLCQNTSDRHTFYNMWFTITARSQQELARIIDEIREKSRIQDLIDLPAVRLFKIRVRFPVLDENAQHPASGIQYPASSIQHPASRTMLTEIEKLMVKGLQEDIPLLERPFEPIAKKLGIDESELLINLQELKGRGVIRRFSAILRHRNLGINANAMGVWAVPGGKVEEIGAKMAAFSQVSHCYQRSMLPGWPYNIYTMIHGKAKEECEQVATLISQETGIGDYVLLYSTRELKKVSMRYFTEEDEGDEKTF